MNNIIRAAFTVCLALLLFTLAPTIVQAQNFRSTLPEDRWLYIFRTASTRGSPVANVLYNEQVRVDYIEKNGWCRVYYTNSEGREITGFTRIGMLIPLDEQATEMKAAFDNQRGLERQVVTLGIILAGIGLVLSFLSFLKHIRTLLLAIIVLSLSAVQIYFLTQTPGFSFYLPSAVGWQWAAIWFGCFTVFLLVQIYLFFATLKTITLVQELVGNTMVVPLLSVLFLVVALMLTVLLPISEDLVYRIFLGINAANIVFTLFYSIVKTGFIRGIFYTIVFTAGIGAIGLMARDVIAVAIVGLLGLFFVQFILTKYAEGGFTQVRVKNSSGNIVTRWGDSLKPGDEELP